MDQALIIMLASFVASMGGRAQHTLRDLDDRLPKSAALASVAILTCIAASFAMAFLGAWLSSQTIGMPRALLASGALVLAAVELFWPVRISSAREPTRSFGAIALVLLARQLPDAPRWFAFAGGAAVAGGMGAGIGSAIGSCVALLAIWIAPWPGRRDRLLILSRLMLALISLLLAGYLVWLAATHGG